MNVTKQIFSRKDKEFSGKHALSRSSRLGEHYKVATIHIYIPVVIDYIYRFCMRKFLSPRSRRRKSSALSESSFGKKNDERRETSEKREPFAGMEMTVDFDLTRQNLITLRTGPLASETKRVVDRESKTMSSSSSSS